MNKNIFFLLGTFVAGIIFFGIYHHWIIITFPGRTLASNISNLSVRKKITLWYWKNGFKNEKKEILWASCPVANATYVVRSWLSILDEENIIASPCSLQALGLSPSHELIVSLDSSFFDQKSSCYTKVMLLDSLFKTIRDSQLPITHIRLLVHHKPLDDDHIDFSAPLPIERTLVWQHSIPLVKNKKDSGLFTIMIDPSGDANNASRIVYDNFERGLTLQCAEKIKSMIEKEFSNVRVILTRLPGQTLDDLQNASFANRIQADLYVHLAICEYTGHETPLYCYYYAPHIQKDILAITDNFSFLPYNMAFTQSLATSHLAVWFFKDLMQSLCKWTCFMVKDPIAIAYRPLAGVTSPAFGIEIGLRDKSELERCIPLCVQALCGVVQKMTEEIQ